MKRVTSKDVAKLAGVSQSTVSLILNNKNNVSFAADTIKRVMDAARELNYNIQPTSRHITRDIKKVIGVIAPTLVNPYYSAIIQIIEQEAIKSGFGVYVCNTHRCIEEERQYLRLLTENAVAGIIFLFAPMTSAELDKLTVNTPTVIVAEKDQFTNVDNVSFDSFKAGSLIASHLVELGHRRIAYLSSPIGNMSVSRQQRLEGIKGYLSSVSKADNLVVRSSNITDESERTNGAYEIELGYQLTLDLLDSVDGITAIIGVCDLLAYGIMAALHSRGIQIPEDISVCGFDNILTSSISYPSLTSIDHCLSHRGKIAFDILLEKIGAASQKGLDLRGRRDSGAYRVEYEPLLVVRNSTGYAKGFQPT